MKPPDIITCYLNAANAGLIDRARDCFSHDAVVHDEGGTHFGKEAIRAWIHDTTEKYHSKVEVLGAEHIEDAVVVTGRVSGNFPGSPVDLEYTFTLEGETISNLSIQ